MRTIEQIRALLITATDAQERESLLTELEQAIQARTSANQGEKPTKVQELRSQLTDVTGQRSALNDQYDAVTHGAVDDSGEAREFTLDEAEQRGRLRAQIDQLDARHDDLEDQVRQAESDEREERSNAAVVQMRRELGLADQSSRLDGITGITEHRIYERSNGVSFLKDLALRGFGPGLGSAWAHANERLSRHAQENHYEALELEKKSSQSDAEAYFVRQMVEQAQGREEYSGPETRSGQFLSYRALSTGSGAGGEFVPPMYLTEDWIAFLRAGRVVANCARHFDLPDGTMSLNVPKVVSGTSVASQGTQNTNVSMTDITTEYITTPVVTIAGAQIISLQLLERSPIQFDEVVWGDLAAAQAQQMDLQVLNGSGSNGQMTGILNTSGVGMVTWTQASPTVKGLMGQVGLAKGDVDTSIFRPATHSFMTPYVWEWIGQSVDTANRPLVVPDYNGPFNAVQVAPDNAVSEGAIGRQFSGLNTFKDANIPANLGSGTNESPVLVSRMQENFLYESPVVTRALPQTLGLQMSVILQLYGYAAFQAGRYPAANQVLIGTGLASSNLTYNN